jgi:hypothetical protein
MRLRLVPNTKEGAVPAPVSAINQRKVILFSALLFLAFKVPMTFNTNNPEELRDYDHFVRSAQGESAYRDFVWFYGPLSPLVYGTALKVLPQKLLTVRLITLAFWTVGAALLGLLLARYLSSLPEVLLGTFVVTNVFGYPSYSHNHILGAVGILASAYWFVRFLEEDQENFLYYSFAGALVSFFSRPILMGIGGLVGWVGLFLWQQKVKDKTRLGSILIIVFGIVTLCFFMIDGPLLVSAFVPRPWAILQFKDYPNLHFMFPPLVWSNPALLARQVWGVFEVGFFYFHYFIWPAILLTMAAYAVPHSALRAAVCCMILGWCTSWDLLHYGFSVPASEQAMWVRGQYFFALTATSVFLVLWPVVRNSEALLQRRVLSAVVLALVGVWGYFPFLLGLNHLARFPVNQYRFPALTGVLTHPDRQPILEAVAFINSLCTEKDAVVVTQYDPGLSQLLKCPDLFQQDSYTYTRNAWYKLERGETPYAPEGGMTNGELVENRIRAVTPRFYLTELPPSYQACNLAGFESRDFGSGANGRRVCWLRSLTNPQSTATSIPE